MAKRKRLAPAQPRLSEDAPLETKSLLRLNPNPAPPIASVAGDASSAAALDELSETLRRARAEGRMIEDIALELIDEDFLMRDRIAVDDEEMEALRTSLQVRGQQTPIEVVMKPDGRYGLVSGWRRCQALRANGASTVRARMTRPGDMPNAYVAMIEENEIRVGLSYFERARVVLKSVENGVFNSHKNALQTLFSTASRAKRSKIKSFIPVVEALGQSLRFPTQLGERLGLDLSKALQEDPTAARRLLGALATDQITSAPEEQTALKQALTPTLEPKKPEAKAELPTEEIIPGVALQISRSGKRISLEGTGVDQALCDDLARWLQTRHR